MALALARKYRPKRFADVAVQSHVSTTLQGAIARDRVAHGYLLCGPRGVGKTTLARVLAMALNCERRGSSQSEGDAGEPCGECESCRRIWSGSASLDVVEIDAASNRGVDDARELRERAMYAPSGDDRYKVYIVDEAHMLTREAWNALLKILEEPPPRVVFVFATTEPQKIAQAAAPVLSRLQRFDLRRIGLADIKARLTHVLSLETVAAEPDAIALIARAADGSMRDALSLTDQVLSMGDGTLTAVRVRDALGLVAEDEGVALLDLLTERRAADVFPFVARLADAGVDFATFLAGFGDIVRAQLAIVLGADAPDVSDRTRAALSERRGRSAAADLVRMLTALTELEPRFRRSGQQQLLIETALVRLALLDRAVDLDDLLRALGRGTGPSGDVGGVPVQPTRLAPTRSAPPAATASAPGRGGDSSRRPQPSASAGAHLVRDEGTPQLRAVPALAPAPQPTEPALLPQPRPAHLQPLDLNRVTSVWDALTAELRTAGKTLVASALEHATPSAVTVRGDLTIALDEPGEFYAKAIEKAAPDIVAALGRWFDPVVRVIVQDHGRELQTPPKRLTGEMLRAEQLQALRAKDPVLAAAIDVLELEVIE